MTTTGNPHPFVHEPEALRAHGAAEAWGSLRWLTDAAQHGVGATVGYVEIGVGEQNPLHRHPDCNEVLVLLEGELAHVVDERVVELAAGDLLVVPAGAVHRARNVGSSAARMLVIYDAGSRSFEPVDEASAPHA